VLVKPDPARGSDAGFVEVLLCLGRDIGRDVERRGDPTDPVDRPIERLIGGRGIEEDAHHGCDLHGHGLHIQQAR
jgi:hypothetical protein